MQLPSYKKKERKKLKICLECGKEFWGHPIAKYCEFHRDIKNRKRRKKVYEAVDIRNQVFQHDFHEPKDIEFNCQLPGCIDKFMVKVFPKQYVYPKFCDKHRSQFKREEFERKSKSNA